MNKFLGYTEIEIDGKVIPIKFGTYALEMFCNAYPTTLTSIMDDVFEEKVVNDKQVVLPKDIAKFLIHAMWAGANYCSKLKGGPEYSIIQAYEWYDEVGPNSEEGIKLMSEFYVSILNGGPMPKASEVPGYQAQKQKAKKKN